MRMWGYANTGRKREHVDYVVFTIDEPLHVTVVAGSQLEECARH